MFETGDILLIRGNTPIVSSAIRWATGSEYTHVAVVVVEDYIYEIDIDKTLAIRRNSYLPHEYDVFRYKKGLTEKQKFMIKAFAICRTRKNRGYDWLRIFSFACQKLFQTKKTFDDIHRVVCSEITDVLYATLGIDLISKKETGNVVPGDFAHTTQLIKVSSHSA